MFRQIQLDHVDQLPSNDIGSACHGQAVTFHHAINGTDYVTATKPRINSTFSIVSTVLFQLIARIPDGASICMYRKCDETQAKSGDNQFLNLSAPLFLLREDLQVRIVSPTR